MKTGTDDNKVQEMGIATIISNSRGLVTQAYFQPTMKLEACDELVNELRLSNTFTKESAQLVFASWFNKMNRIEMAEDSTIEIEELGSNTVAGNKLAFTFRFVLKPIVATAVMA